MELLSEIRGRALWLTINRPERRNAINPAVIAGLSAALARAEGDPALRAVVLTGAGDRAFCAGADLSRGTEMFHQELADPGTDFGRLARQAHGFRLPLVARINGACVAGGMGLMALCDLAVAVDHARFGLPETRVGVFPMQVFVYLRLQMLPRHFNELCMTGEIVDAAQAREWGLVNHVVPAAELDAKVEWLLARLADKSPVAMRRGKLAMAAMQGMGFEQAIAFAEAQIKLQGLTEDAAEGIAAFNEKRPPRWAE